MLQQVPALIGSVGFEPWPIKYYGATRRASGRVLSAAVYTTLGSQRTDEINAQFIRVFARDVRELATAYGCRIMVVTTADCAWRRNRSQPYTIVEQWRI